MITAICVLNVALVAAALPVSPIEAQHSGIFQYSRNLEPHQYQFGYTRGDGSHRIARRQQADGSHFETKVKWDAEEGRGESTWDYNHDQKHQHDPDTSYQDSGSNQHAIVQLPDEKMTRSAGYNPPVYQPNVYKTVVQRSPVDDLPRGHPVADYPSTIYRTGPATFPAFQ